MTVTVEENKKWERKWDTLWYEELAWFEKKHDWDDEISYDDLEALTEASFKEEYGFDYNDIVVEKEA